MLAQSYPPVIGGEERVVQDLSRQLVARGHSVAVATLSPGAGPAADGVRVHRLGATAARRPRSARRGDGGDVPRPHAPPVPDPETVLGLRRVLARERPDVVHAHNWIVHSLLPLRAHRPALVLSLHDYALVCATKRLFRHGAVCSGPGPLKCVACAGEQFGRAAGAVTAAGLRGSAPRLRRAVDMMIPISTAVRDSCGLAPSPSVRVIPNFAAPLPARPLAAPAGLPDEPFILFFGDASVDKGAAHLAAVHRSLSAPPPLVFAGRCLIEELRTQPGVIVTGPLPHAAVIEAVRRSLFTVAPSLWAEPFGLVALESAAAGRPVVASATGGLRDLVRDGETGLLVAPGDATALRRALTMLIGDPGLRERLGAAARRHAATFSAETIVPRFEEAYRDAIAARARRAGTR